MLLWARRSQDGHWHLDHSCSPLWGVGTLYTGLGYNIASQLRRVIGCGAHTSLGCHDVPSCIQALCINPAIQNTILAPWTKRARYRMFYSSAPVQEGVYVCIYIYIFGYIFGIRVHSWLGVSFCLFASHPWDNGPTVPVSCSMALAMQGLCSGDFCGMSGINWVQGQTEGGDPRCYEAEEPRSALAKDQLGPCFNGKMLQDWGTSSTNGGFSRARFRTDWHIPASRCSVRLLLRWRLSRHASFDQPTSY